MIVIDDPWHDIPPHGPSATRVRRRALLWLRRVRFRRRAKGLRGEVLRRHRIRMARRQKHLIVHARIVASFGSMVNVMRNASTGFKALSRAVRNVRP